MNDVDDSDYFYDRAEAELKLAQTAEHPAVVKAHYVLAGYYLDKVYGPADQHTPAVPLTAASEPLATRRSPQSEGPPVG